MSIDYKIAANAINNAIDCTRRGIGSLVGGNYRQPMQPAFAYAPPGSNVEACPSRELYDRRGGRLPSIDFYVTASNSSTKPVVSPPTAKEMLYRLINFF